MSRTEAHIAYQILPSPANNNGSTGCFQAITVQVPGDSYTVVFSYTTTIRVVGNCFSTSTHTISGTGTIFVDEGGPELIGEIPD